MFSFFLIFANVIQTLSEPLSANYQYAAELLLPLNSCV